MTLLSRGESIQLGGVGEIIPSFNLSQENTAGLDRQRDKLRPTKRERCSVGNLRSTQTAIASALGGTSAESPDSHGLSTQERDKRGGRSRLDQKRAEEDAPVFSCNQML
jgi:hypothetical protein